MAGPPCVAQPQNPSTLTFLVSDVALGKHVTVVVYGDMLFHDPAKTLVANHNAGKRLVDRIA